MRAQIKIDHKNKHAGFFRRKTNDVVRIDRCPLLVDEINEVLAKLNSGMINIIPDDVKVIKILSGNNTASDPVIDGLTNSTATVIVQNHPLSVIASEAKQSRNGLSTSIPASGLLRRYAPRNDVNVNPNEQSGTIQFLVNGNSFFQSNRFLLEKLGNWAHGSIGGGYCLDLYGGIGFFSLMLGDDFESVVLVENVAAQVSAAQKNFEINGKNHIKAILADVEKEGSLDKLVTPRKPDCVIIDPPRPGLTKSVRKWLVDTMPPIILYISCNPSTFARDAGALVRGGYKLSQWALFDLYPNTHHIESAAMFTRRN
jgi:23S rRNA (uracil1939-C5)-methyltransferase